MLDVVAQDGEYFDMKFSSEKSFIFVVSADVFIMCLYDRGASIKLGKDHMQDF